MSNARDAESTPVSADALTVGPTEVSRFIAAASDRFEFEGEMRSSGMSIVFRVRERSTGELRALKVFRTSIGARSAEAFAEHLAPYGKLVHPNILSVLDYGTTDDRLWYTMPYLDASSLDERLKSNAPFQEHDAVSMLRDIAEAIESAHELGLLHGELKPSNIFHSNGKTYVAGFGVFHAFMQAMRQELQLKTTRREFNTIAMIANGTTGYMAPEQVCREQTVDASDLYSIGALGYKFLTGQRPFEGDSQLTFAVMQMTRPPAPVSNLRPAMNPLLAQLVMRLLEPLSYKRPQSAAQVVATLDKVAEGVTELEPVAAVEPRTPLNGALNPTFGARYGPPRAIAQLPNLIGVAREIFNELRNRLSGKR